ncbi:MULTISPECIES: serine hydrolase domain-containing protein [Streptomyces]|uniref:Beta-lactamase family protein n=1 Tax=Streptomyces sudanensis TaxID=436397 RepID=A0ABY4TGP2_9ACTN|nr:MULTISPECIES: serine hydrolase domain-containing protein [Streptomyces]MCP9956908.1 beta-lactamase family protein [Streptomyces sudanensis]MCP9986093.1 beta-lactamase family protein [Streptomyces sudanensis]MCQ0002509.1 beta-lactamase family protein [Streptomyces sudanensis]URN17279.1 beta-lactamase family protein [Streptomyces sudanensis]
MDVGVLSGMVNELIRDHRIPGAQLSVYSDGTLWEVCTGVERIGSDVPVSVKSRFAYGSVSKIFTAALVMQLVEEGEVELDTPVMEVLADVAGHTAVPADHPMHQVTLRQLLSHTAGLVSDYEGAPLRSPSLRRYFESVVRDGHFGVPGTAFSYSNTGYAVAAYVVEALTGQSWWDSLESYLAHPTGLDLAFVEDPRPGRGPGATVSGHAVNARTGRTEPVDFYCESTLAAAGGIAGSATDLVRFGRAFLGEGHEALDADIADPDVLAVMGHAVPAAEPFGLAAGWGAGWGLYPAGESLWLGHDGTLDGGSCNVRVDQASGTALAFTTNSTTGLAAWFDLVGELDRTFGLRVGHYEQPAPAGRPCDEAAALAGEFVNGELAIRVSHEGDGGRLRLDADNGVSGVLTVGSDLIFSVRAADQGDVLFSGRFLSSGKGRPADLMQYNGRTLRRAARKICQAA